MDEIYIALEQKILDTVLFYMDEIGVEETREALKKLPTLVDTILKEREVDILIEDFIGAYNVLQEKGVKVTVNNYAESIDIYNANDFDFKWED